MTIVDNNDLFGRFFLRKYGTSGIDGYYASLFALEPLLRSREWNVTKGYYLNIEPEDSVRLSYFIPPGKDAVKLVGDFIKQNGLEYTKKTELPTLTKISKHYGGDELRFRKFLSTYAPIGLDIMKADLLHARCLFATFRFQVAPLRKPYRPHFEDTFSKQSIYYRLLLEKDKEEFWKDMSHWPNPRQVDWAHMFVNMVLGCDYFLQRRKALSIPEINKILSKNSLSFEVPEGWDPSDV